MPTLEANLPDKSEAKLGLDTFKDRLVGLGYQEVITYSFISPELHNVFFDSSSVLVQNPISADMSSMRTSLIPGLVNTALYNINRQQKRLSLFEAGLTFLPQTNGLPKQDIMIAGLLTGDVHSQTWTEKSREADFFDIKGDVEALLSHLSHDLSFERADLTYLHPGQSANILSKDKVIGHIGAIHPSTAQKAGLSQQAYVFELNVSEIEKKEVAVFSEISRFPEVRRDLAIIVGEAVSADQIESVVKLNAGEYFKSFNIFDVYQGKGIELQRKSIALGLTFQSKSSTLTDDTINQIIDKVIHALSQDLNAVLRS